MRSPLPHSRRTRLERMAISRDRLANPDAPLGRLQGLELRRYLAEPRGERAIRSRAWRLHRSTAAADRPLRACEQRTLFLDEIGELPAEIQVKLLRVLQEQEFERVGGSQTIRADVRLVAATSRDLASEVNAGRFRPDLYYRINIFPIRVPPLRDRRDDIPLLVDHFLRKLSPKLGKSVEGVSRGSMHRLQDYHWPGNIRELQNVLERATVLA
jgi:transcriptional regulator of acetoin/glycerol metabolism